MSGSENFVENVPTLNFSGPDLNRIHRLGKFSPAPRMNFSAAVATTIGLLGVTAHAQLLPQPSPLPPVQLQSEVALDWLDRISRSSRELPYTGIFVHQTAEGASTSRITHLVDKQGVEHEKLELMDGPLTEIIRRDEELTCYRPDSRTMSIDRRATGRFFPSQ